MYVLSKNEKNIKHFSTENVHFLQLKKSLSVYYSLGQEGLPCTPRRILWEWYKIVHWTSLVKNQDVNTRYRAMEPPFRTVFKMAAMQKCQSACSVLQ